MSKKEKQAEKRFESKFVWKKDDIEIEYPEDDQ